MGVAHPAAGQPGCSRRVRGYFNSVDGCIACTRKVRWPRPGGPSYKQRKNPRRRAAPFPEGLAHARTRRLDGAEASLTNGAPVNGTAIALVDVLPPSRTPGRRRYRAPSGLPGRHHAPTIIQRPGHLRRQAPSG